MGINDPTAGLLLLTQPPVQSSRGQQAGDVDHAPLCVSQMMLDSLKTQFGDCVFIAMLSDGFGLGFERDKVVFFFFFNQTVRLPACLTIAGQWGPGQLSVP